MAARLVACRSSTSSVPCVAKRFSSVQAREHAGWVTFRHEDVHQTRKPNEVQKSDKTGKDADDSTIEDVVAWIVSPVEQTLGPRRG
eukprot:4028977-Prymnesium_polylepis.1